MATTYDIPVDEISSGFHALSDPIRVKVLELLQQQELCVGSLCEALDTNQSKLSFHLKVLKDAELVNSRHEGRWIFYSLNIMQVGWRSICQTIDVLAKFVRRWFIRRQITISAVSKSFLEVNVYYIHLPDPQLYVN